MRSRVLLTLAALTLSLLLPGAVGARSADAAATTAAQAAQAEHDRILAYWTPARIAAARWKDATRDPSSGRLTSTAGKPGGGNGAVTGASWTGNGIVEQRVGRILFSSGGGQWICSGTVVSDASTSNGYSVVLTAGHCVYDGADGWSSNLVFYPDFDDEPNYDCATRVIGCWTATRLAANSDFLPGGFGSDAALRVDYGFAFMPSSSDGELDAVTGGYGLKTSGATTSDTQWSFGYPAEGRYKGKDLIYCKGTTIDDPYDVGTWGMACNENGGSSGGGWLFGPSDPGTDGAKLLSSVNSYRYTGLTYMFGPRFNSETPVVMADVIDGSATAGVSAVH